MTRFFFPFIAKSSASICVLDACRVRQKVMIGLSSGGADHLFGNWLQRAATYSIMNHHQLHMTSAATSISDTPQEILDRILDFLHDNRATLYSASLVSHAWVHAPRYHLFSQTLLTEIYGRGRLLKENARSFLVLAHSEHCTILPAIQYVIFVVATQELVDDLVKILAPSKRLSQLTYIHTLRSETISWNAQILSNIHDFSFDFLWYNFDADAWRLVTSFPNLHSLALYTNATCPITLPSSIPGYIFRNLRTLRLRLVASEELFEWLKKLDGTRFILETLDLRMFRPDRGTSWGSMRALNSFLKEVSDTLKHLSIGISYDAGLNELSESSGTRSSFTLLCILIVKLVVCHRSRDTNRPRPISQSPLPFSQNMEHAHGLLLPHLA
jgi:hypothetical protein